MEFIRVEEIIKNIFFYNFISLFLELFFSYIGYSYFVSLSCGVFCGVLFLIFEGLKNDILGHDVPKCQKMSVHKFLIFLSLLLAGQLYQSLALYLLEYIFNICGVYLYNKNSFILSISNYSIFYLCVVAPVAEEFVYRKYIRLCCKRYEIFFTTSVYLFVLMHGDFSQMFFAMYSGIIFTYVSIHYSTKYSCIMHICNNTFVVLSSYFAKRFGLCIEYIFNMLILLCFVNSICVFFSKRMQVLKLIKVLDIIRSLKIVINSIWAFVFFIFETLIALSKIC